MAATTAVVAGKTSPDPKDDQETQAIDAAYKRAETTQIVEGNLDKRANRRLRGEYADKVFCYLICYSLFCAILLIVSGFNFYGFALPQTVLGIVVGSTAASAIGLVGFVVNGLFKGR